ncbi:MAG: type II toxin-antitoxin system RelE/ParE family toxin [Candidatus Levybacteria bacterium]|nr:type II toxin-antitoxin system RelE/ParE family toxin [Candidatus Levybacteria bacterium]
MNYSKKMQKNNETSYSIILPSQGRGSKEITLLLRERKPQLLKAINKLKVHPTDFSKQGIEKLQNSKLGDYSIRVTKNHRLFYDVDLKNKRVNILRVGKHDLYKLV